MVVAPRPQGFCGDWRNMEMNKNDEQMEQIVLGSNPEFPFYLLCDLVKFVNLSFLIKEEWYYLPHRETKWDIEC